VRYLSKHALDASDAQQIQAILLRICRANRVQPSILKTGLFFGLHIKGRKLGFWQPTLQKIRSFFGCFCFSQRRRVPRQISAKSAKGAKEETTRLPLEALLHHISIWGGKLVKFLEPHLEELHFWPSRHGDFAYFKPIALVDAHREIHEHPLADLHLPSDPIVLEH
jgi:hypothetical protein